MLNHLVSRLTSLAKAAVIVLLTLLVAPRLVSAALSSSCAPLLTTSVIDETRTTTLVSEIRALAELELSTYSDQVLVEETVPARFFGMHVADVRIFLSVQGTITGGIDLSGFSLDDISDLGGRLVIHLPDPRILSCSIESGLEEVFPRDLPMGSADDIALLKDTMMETARSEMVFRALNEGILETARENLRQRLDELMDTIGYDGSVEIVFDSDAAGATSLTSI